MENQPIKENNPSKLDRAVKISVIIGALIVGLSIAYYLVIFLPQKAKMTLEQQSERCYGASQNYFKDYMKKQGEYAQNYQSSHYQYSNHYNQKLNKCFIDIVNNESYEYHSTVYDVYENKEWGGIDTAGETVGNCGLQKKGCKSKVEFNNLIQPLMEQ